MASPLARSRELPGDLLGLHPRGHRHLRRPVRRGRDQLLTVGKWALVIPLGGGPLNLTTLLLGAVLSAVLVSSAGAPAPAGQVRVQRAVAPPVLAAQRPGDRRHHVRRLPAGRLQGSPDGRPDRVILIAFYMFLTTRTVLGRRIYAVGGNAKAAMLSGVNSKRMVFLTFVNMGVLAALGGLIIWRGSTPPRRTRDTASSSTSSPRRSSAAPPPTAASARSPAPSSAPCSSAC